MPAEHVLRVVTLNIWNRMGPWEARREVIRAGLRELAPDLVGLQEVVRMEGEYVFDQLAELADGLGFHVAYGRSDEAKPWGLGNAVLSRWPIATSRTFSLAGTDEARCLLFCEVDSPFGTIPFFCTHLNWQLHHGHVRQSQVKQIAAHVAQHAPESGFPPILVGDFNADEAADEIRYLRGYTDLGGGCVYFADAFACAGRRLAGPYVAPQEPLCRAAPRAEPPHRLRLRPRAPTGRGGGEPLRARVVFDEPVGRHVGERSFRGARGDLRVAPPFTARQPGSPRSRRSA
jgi:endonuclease/exonuclease/phosphatase family metal-dependent hydrolase